MFKLRFYCITQNNKAMALVVKDVNKMEILKNLQTKRDGARTLLAQLKLGKKPTKAKSKTQDKKQRDIQKESENKSLVLMEGSLKPSSSLLNLLLLLNKTLTRDCFLQDDDTMEENQLAMITLRPAVLSSGFSAWKTEDVVNWLREFDFGEPTEAYVENFRGPYTYMYS